MKNRFNKITALTLALLTLGAFASCGENEEEINDSQESSAASDAEYAGETVINVALTYYDSNIISKAEAFSKDSAEYEIHIRNYTENNENNDAFDRLKMDILSGEPFDIVVGAPQEISRLVSAGYMTDIYPLMEQGSGVKREDFLPNVLAGLEQDGELSAMCYGFRIRTAAAKTDNVGAEMENWTQQEAMDFYNNMPDGTEYLYHETMWYDFPNYMLAGAARAYIDLENSACSFDDGEFAELLDMLVSLPEFENTEFDAGEMALVNDNAFISEVWINGINSYAALQLYCSFGGADITYVGYPSSDGNGAITETDVMFGILDSSSAKSGAWEFLSTLFTDGFQKNIGLDGNIPVTVSTVDYLAYDLSEWNGGSIREKQEFPYGSGQIMQMSDEAIQQLADYVSTVDFEPYFDSQLNSIVKEEYRAVLEGESTPQEGAQMLQNRISIYLSERE